MGAVALIWCMERLTAVMTAVVCNHMAANGSFIEKGQHAAVCATMLQTSHSMLQQYSALKR